MSTGFIHALEAPITEVKSVDSYGVGMVSMTSSKDSSYPGSRFWRWVKNADASAWATGNIILQKFTTLVHYEGTVLGAGASSQRIKTLGVAQFAVAAASWAWIACGGVADVLMDTTSTVGDALVVVSVDAAGSGSAVTASTAAHALQTIGVVLETSASTDTVRKCRLTGLM